MVYLLLRLSQDHGDVPEGNRLVVRAAREQFGLSKNMTESRRQQLREVALWDYGHCINPWAAQGGEWDRVVVLGPGWEAIYPRASYVGVTRAVRQLIVCGDQGMTKGQAVQIAMQVYERVVR